MKSRLSKPKVLWIVTLILAVSVWAGVAGAQLPVPPSTQFDITGFLQEATLANPADPLSGGTLKVNGHVVTVPAKTIVIYPANALTFAELFTKAPAPYTGVATGMAMADVPTPLTTYEVHVVGNRVADVYIAGLIDISQQSLNSGAGFINFIDYAAGEMRVGGVIGNAATGTRVRLNDPVGRYGRATTSPDVRFTVDPDNPTIMAGTGYPMCLPRTAPAGVGVSTDALCPEENRPIAAAGPPTVYNTNFTTNNLTNPNFPIVPGFPDSTKQAPFEVGDYVTYAGTLVQDCPACPGGGSTAGPWPALGTAATWIAAHTITNNIAIYTFQGSNPAYVSIDVSLIGTGGLTVIGVGEAAIRTRFEGMMTDVDPSGVNQRRIHLYGIDLDPLGNSSDRDFGTIFPDPGPPNGAVKGRWRFRPPCAPFGTDPATIKVDKQCIMNAAGTFLPPPREVRAVIEGLQTQNPALPGAQTAANGLFYGQYHAPIGEYIFPENVPGTPIVENNFNAIPFLACGGYSSSGIDIPPTVPVLANGPLSPWPSNVAPNQAACINFVGPQSVTATAAPNPAVTGQLVTLTATATGAAPLSFTWAQTAGPAAVNFTQNPLTGVATFTAPTVTPPSQTLSFTVTVSNPQGNNSAPVSVQVNAAAATDLVSVTTAEYRTGQRRLALTATDSVPTAVLTLQPYQCETNTAPCVGGFYNPDPAAGGVGNVLTNNGGGTYTITLVGAPPPACKLGGTYATPCTQAPIKVRSNLGGVNGTGSALTRIRQ
jgi:hypothetical protein